ncbi:MAG: FliG C-terminal domain-containing protein [Myxococcota bacterium]|nr:FliG C-terminal domain-containing protein [Myxococcota bacterium]
MSSDAAQAAAPALLSGVEKAAVLVLSLPTEAAREVLSRMDRSEIESILSAVSRIEQVTEEMQAQVLAEFRAATQPEGGVRGGVDRTLELIDALVPDEHAEVLRAKHARDRQPIAGTILDHEPEFVAETIAPEDPQTIALVISQLPARRGAAIIAALPEAVRTPVVRRLATLAPVSREVVDQVAAGLEETFREREGHVWAREGTEVAAQLLVQLEREQSEALLEGIREQDGATAVRIEDSMLTFDQLASIDDRGFKKLLQEIPMEDLVLALKACSDEMRDKVYRNLSKRAGDALQEEVETLGPRRLSEVEAKHREIIAVARKLAESGEIAIGAVQAGGDDLV